MVWQDQMKANGVFSVNLLFKILMRESLVDSTSTLQLLQQRIQYLYLFMPTVSNTVLKFNIHVKKQIKALNARGHAPQNLLLNLLMDIFNVRKMPSMKVQISVATGLITLAADKYRSLKENGEWEAPSPDGFYTISSVCTQLLQRPKQHARHKHTKLSLVKQLFTYLNFFLGLIYWVLIH